MSIELKQIIHIVCEIIVIVSVSIYFNHQINLNFNRYKELKEVVEKQQETIENQEKMIYSLMANMAKMEKLINNIMLERHTNSHNHSQPQQPPQQSTTYKQPPIVLEVVPEDNEDEEETSTTGDLHYIPLSTTPLLSQPIGLMENMDGFQIFINSSQASSIPFTTSTVEEITEHPTTEPITSSEPVSQNDGGILPQRRPNKNQRQGNKKPNKLPPTSPAFSDDLDREIQEELRELHQENELTSSSKK